MGRPILFETHALRRMGQRGISKKQVEKAVNSGRGKTRPAKRPGATRIEYKISSRRRLVVIVEKEERFIRVVTAFWV